MTFGFILLTAGLAALIAGIKGVTIADVLKGAIGDDNPIFQRGLVSGAAGAGADEAPYHGKQESSDELQQLLTHLQGVASDQFHLEITEPIGRDGGSHAEKSYHKTGEAFDASGTEQNMHDFAKYVDDHYRAQITELIHNPGFSVKNGKRVGVAFWGGDTWREHGNHVHLAIHWRGAHSAKTVTKPRRGAHGAKSHAKPQRRWA